jgi:RND family efflux transporter MFP subunit
MTMTFAKWKAATAGAVLALGLASTWGLAGGFQVRPGEKPSKVPNVTEVEVAQTITREVRDYEDFVGRTELIGAAEIHAQVSGPLEKAHFPEGGKVKKADRLFQIEAKPHQAEVEAARAALDRSEAQVKLANAVVARNKALLVKGPQYVSQQEIDKASADLSQARAVRYVSQTHLDQAERALDFTQIRSPIEGEIARSLVAPGAPIKAGETVLARFVATDPMAVVFEVDERTILKISRMSLGIKDLPIRLGLADEEDFPHTAKMESDSGRIDPATGTVRFRAAVPNPGLIMLPGMFARVRMGIGPPHEALLVPEAAVLTEGGRKFLYALDDRDRVELRPVTLGLLHDGFRVVREGLKLGERVVVGRLKDVRPGMTVKPRPTPAPQP